MYGDVLFVINDDPIIIGKLLNEGFKFMCYSNSVISSPKILRKVSPDRIIIDIPFGSKELLRLIRNVIGGRSKIIILGDSSFNIPEKAEEFCDVIVDFNLSSAVFQNEKFYDPITKTLFLKGPKYIPIRDEFLFCARDLLGINNVRKITLIFGGSDPRNLTTRSLKLIDEFYNSNHIIWIDVIIGPKFTNVEELKRVSESINKPIKLTIHRDIPNVADFVCHADLVLTSPGMSMLEALAASTPTAAFIQNNIQRKVYSHWKIVYELEDMPRIISSIFSGEYLSFFAKYFENVVRKMEIGLGKYDVIRAVVE